MALLSGEVETLCRFPRRPRGTKCSGWLCYPGKLKPVHRFLVGAAGRCSGWLCYPGKLKHARRGPKNCPCRSRFRMALLFGEVETAMGSHRRGLSVARSGWLCYPGKLKLDRSRSGYLPGADGYGWLCYSGKLKQCRPAGSCRDGGLVLDGFAIRSS